MACPLVTPRLWLIDCDYPEEVIRNKFPSFYSYLQKGKRRNIHAGYIASRRRPWYSQEKREPAPFLCTYMGRTGEDKKPFRFLWNKSMATAHNVYLLLYTRPPLSRLLEKGRSLFKMVFDALREIDTGYIVGAGRVYGGGLHKVEPNELSLIAAESLTRVFPSIRLTHQHSLFN